MSVFKDFGTGLWFAASAVEKIVGVAVGLLALLLIASIFIKPLRQLIVDVFWHFLEEVILRNPGLRFDRAIRNYRASAAELSQLDAKARGNVKDLEQKAGAYQSEVDALTQRAAHLKRNYESATDAQVKAEKFELAKTKAKELADARAKLRVIVGDPDKGVPSALEAARKTQQQSKAQLDLIESKIEELETKKEQVLEAHEISKTQKSLFSKLNRHGANSDDADLEKLTKRINQEKNLATGMADQYENSHEAKSRKADVAARDAEAEDILNSL